MYDIRERDQAIRMLQILLLEISYADPDIPHLTVDGIFGDRTKRALRIFQKKNGFTANGRADFATWNALRVAYLDARKSNQKEK